MHPDLSGPAPHEIAPATASFLSEAHTAAAAVYFKNQPPGQKSLPEGWSRLPVPEGAPHLAATLQRAGAEYLRSPSGTEFVAFRGTIPSHLDDWGTNVANAVGAHNVKYDAAAEIGAAFRHADPPVAFTGHSLGGGLAKLAAEAASKGAESKTCVAFNAAPVSPGTYLNHDLPPQRHERTTIHVVNEHDILNRAVKGGKISAFGGAALGERERLPNSMIVLAKGSGSAVGASGHGIQNFVPMGDLSHAEHFTAPLSRADGTAVDPHGFDRFAPRMPEAGRTGAILEAARSDASHDLQRAHQLGHGR